MRKQLTIGVLGLCLTMISGFVKAQVDPHFSQYYMYPMWLNPALTGAIDGEYRVNALYRSQWSSFGGGYTTTGLSFDAPGKKTFNFGGNLLNQAAGDGGYNFTNAYGSISYTGIKFGKAGNHQIHMGLQIGLINRRINPAKFQFGSDWNPVTGYVQGSGTPEAFAATSKTSFDAGFGALYFDADPEKKVNIYGGFSVGHITRPRDPFILSSSEARVLPMRWNFHGGVRIQVNESTVIVPNFVYLRQGNAYETMLGGYVQLNANAVTDVLFGANLRFNDALVPYAGVTYNNFTFGISYDANVTNLRKLGNGGANSFELTLSYTKKRANQVAPQFLRCPRL